MVNYLIRRIIFSIVVLIGISFVSFVVIELPPGDFATTYKNRLINQAGMAPEEAEAQAQTVRERYGLEGPLVERWFHWVKGILTEGDFGPAMSYGGKEVSELLRERLPRTILLALSAHAISSVVGIAIGIYIAQRQYGWADNLAAFFAFILTSIPRFSLALIVAYILVFGFGQQSIGALFSPQYMMAPWSWGKFVDLIKHVWPVILIAGLGGVAQNMRVMRGNLLDVLNSQYVTTARSKGLKESRVINRHAVPNALHAIIMYQGAVLPYMVQGELEVAIVLSIPTVSPLFYDSISKSDQYVTASILLMTSLLLVIGNLIADIALAWLDPRIRYE
jgi:peptide/nickel transport system permease protein